MSLSASVGTRVSASIATGPLDVTYFDSVADLRAYTGAPINLLFVAGYYGAGTPGGGFFEYVSTAGADNGGTIIHDSLGQPYIRQHSTGIVYEFGAFADAVISTVFGTVDAGSHTFTTPTPIPTSFIGKRIAIVGAGPSNGTLSTIMDDIVGNVVTLHDAATIAVPTYLPNRDNAVVAKGSGYAANDTSVMSDGTKIRILDLISKTDSGVLGFQVLTQGNPLSSVLGTITQVSTSGGGTGFTCTLGYVASGQYAYGSDDSAAINAALTASTSSGASQGVVLPNNAICGVYSTINLPVGKANLIGGDQWNCGVIALAELGASVIFHPSDQSPFGGQASSFWVDAFLLADSAIEKDGGRAFRFYNISARNGRVQQFLSAGSSTDANGGTTFDCCDARYVTSTFARLDQLPNYGFNFQSPGGAPAFVYAPSVSCAKLALMMINSPGVHVESGNIFGAPPYNAQYGYDVRKQCSLVGVQVGNISVAAVHVAGARVACINLYAQWAIVTVSSPALASTYAVLIEADGSGFFTKGCVVADTLADACLPNANIVAQLGAAGVGTIVTDNPNATYTTDVPVIGKNYVENSNFIVWQEKQSYSLTSALTQWVTDRWKAATLATTNYTVSRDAGFSGAQYCLKIQRVPGENHNQFIRLCQQFKSSIAYFMAGKTVTISYDVIAGADWSGSENNCLIFSGTGVGEVFNLQTDAFPTGSVASSNLQTAIPVPGGPPVRMVCTPYLIPANAGEVCFVIIDNGIGVAGADDILRITNVKFEIGYNASAYLPDDPAETWYESQRYYRKTFLLATAPAQNAGANTGEFCAPATKAGALKNILGTLRFEAMNVMPTITAFNPAVANAQARDEDAGADCSSTLIDNITETSARISAVGASGTAVGNNIGVHLVIDARGPP